MHHEAETSIFLRVGELFTYSFVLACVLWDEIYASFTTLKYSLVLVFEAMIPLLAWHRQRSKNKEKRVERRKATGERCEGSSAFSGSGTATDSESAAQSRRAPLEGSSTCFPKSATAAASSGAGGAAGVVKKKSFSAFHHKLPSSAQTPKSAEMREQGKCMPTAFSSSSVSESASNGQQAKSTAAVDEGTMAQSLATSLASPLASASTSAAAVSRSTPLSIFSANHIKKAIRAHAGAVPNQMLWVPTGKNPPLWPTQRIVRGILRNQGVTKPKILAVDLDETLLCALPFSAKGSARYGKPTYHEAIPTASGAEIYAVWERPHVQLFLSAVARLYTVVVFTASVPFYADPFIDRLEGITPNDYRPQSSSVTSRIHKPLRIRRRYYRDCCVPIAATPTAAARVAAAEKKGDTTASGMIATQTLDNKASPPSPTPTAAGVGAKEETSTSSYALSGRSSPSSPLVAADSLSLSSATTATAAAVAAAHNAGYEGDDTQSSAPPSATSTLGADQTAVARGELDKLIAANKASSPSATKPRQAIGKAANSGGGGGGLENASFSSQASSASSIAPHTRAPHGPPRQHTDATKTLNHRQQSTQQQQRFAKDLSVFGVPLDSVVLLDNSLESFALFPNNGILIDSYRPPLASASASSSPSGKGVAKAHHRAHHQPSPAPVPTDDALLSLIPFLEALYYVPDVRQVLSRRKKD